MARIRTLKPEFWTSEQITECSPNARLLFVGVWTFSDDNGIHPASIKRLKMEVFPSDDFTQADIAAMVDELVAVGLLRPYTVDGEGYWQVTGWHHQKIDQPTFKHPLPDGSLPRNVRRRFAEPDSPNKVQRTVAEGSPKDQRTFDECSPPEGKGREGKELTTPDGVVVASKPAPPDCPHSEIVAAYHELLPTLRRVREWTPDRQAFLRARWRENPERQSLAWWRGFFGYVAGCPLLMGEVPGRDGGAPFSADLEWLVRPTNFRKVIEGKYQRRAA